ncbi:Uma2 family endonuclease [soil metagenome]
MTLHATLVTADQLLHMPDDGVRRELVQGELCEMTPSGSEHGFIASRLAMFIAPFVEEKRLGATFAAETGFLLATNPDTVRAPDLAYVAMDRVIAEMKPSGYFPGAPDLAIEVISPGDSYAEVEAKVETWLEAGCRMVVVVNPRNRTLKVFRTPVSIAVLQIDDSFDGAEILPGFRLPLRQIFPAYT